MTVARARILDRSGRRLSTPARRLAVGAALLLAWSGVGGIVSVRHGVNTWADAWTADATLAAPWPMVLVQLTATLLAVLGRRGWAVAGATVLALGAFLSAISGFFDGQFARADLPPALVVLQAALVLTAGAVVVLAVLRLRELLPDRRVRSAAAPTGCSRTGR